MDNIKIFKDISKDQRNILTCSCDNKNVYLGSKYNETKNIQKFINDLKIDDGEAIVIVIGLASGEYLKEILSILSENNKLIIIETDEAIYKLNLKNEQVLRCINNNKLNYILYKNNIQIRTQLEKLIDKSYIPVINFGIYTNYKIVYNKQCNNIVLCINEYLEYINLLRNSNIKLKDNVLKNYLTNLKYLGKSVNAINFKDSFKGKTSVIVSSGPSLSKNIKDLKNFNNDVIIIAVARSLNELLQNDIVPHFICAVDPGDVMFELIKNNLECDIPIIVSEQTNKKIIEQYKGNKIFILDSFKDIVAKVNGEKYISLPNGGSVAHVATSFSVLTGVKNVIFVGQDLAFTDMQYHSKLSTNEELLKSKAFFDKNSLITIEGNCEPIVYTNSTFMAFKNWFEKFIDSNNNVNYINATEGGAKINGTKILTLKESLELYSNENLHVKDIINNIIKCNIKNENKIIEFLKLELKELKEECLNGIKLSSDMLKYYYDGIGNINSILKKLDKIDNRLEKYNEINYFINLVAYEDLEKIKLSKQYRLAFNENQNETNIRISKKQIAIYNANKKAIENILDVLNDKEVTI